MNNRQTDEPRAKPSRALRTGPWFYALISVLLLATCLIPLLDNSGSGRIPRRFACVVPGVLYRSSQPTREELMYLVDKFNIRSVISLRKGTPDTQPVILSETQLLSDLKLHYRQICMNTPPTLAQVNDFITAAADPGLPRPILVHCKSGRTRTGAATAFWRMIIEGWSSERAVRDARSNGLHDEKTIRLIRDYSPARGVLAKREPSGSSASK